MTKLAELSVALQNATLNNHMATLRAPESSVQVVFGRPYGNSTGTFHNVGKGDHLRLLAYDSTMSGPWGFDITCVCDIDRTFTQVDQTGAVIGSPQTVAGGSGGVASFSALAIGDQINVG